MSKETTVQLVETDASKWRRAKELFLDAIELPEADRARFLDDKCGSDWLLKEEIEQLIEAHFESESFIENPAFKITSVFGTNGANQKEKVFGNYKIIREIGVGGMGAVYLAERADGEFQRAVAIKIVRQNFADRELISRFKRERQILASLDHPFIAKLLDGGVSSDGIPFLVMEYIDGEPITEFAAARNLNADERLNLFLKICAAVADAHRNLVVHRDLKPSNIFVTKDGTPKLLDFGLAKLIDEDLNPDESQTLTAFRAMTPAYASPEQLRGELITTSSDIYSLGVVLYELLTGDRPFHFKNQNLNEMIAVICKSESARPSEAVTADMSIRKTDPKGYKEKRNGERETGTRECVETRSEKDSFSSSSQSFPLTPLLSIASSRLKGDLDNIVMTAMMKEPERRYPTVEKFADDIERHLKGLPVRARPNTFSYRAGKFIKRNFWGAIAGFLILLTLLAGIAATLWQSHRAEQQRERAENHFNDVRRLANSVLFEINPKIENLSGATEAREIIVRRALEYLDALAAESSGDADLQRELAAAYEKVGDVQGNPSQPNLGDMKGALISYQKAETLREALVNNSSQADLSHELATNYEKVGYLLWWSDDTEGAVKYFERGLDRRRKLIDENPDSVEYKKGLASLLMTYGDVPAWNKETAQAIEKFDESMAILKKLNAENPNDVQLQASLGRCYFRIGNAENFAGDYENALKNLAQSETIFQKLVAKDPNDYYFRRGLWQTKFRQCENYLFKPDNIKAGETCPQLIDLANNLVAKDSKDKLMKHDLASSYYYTGEAFAALKEYAKAIANYQKASVITTGMIEQFPDNSEYQRSIATYDIGISESQLELKQIPQALENAQNAQRILEPIINEDAENKMPQVDLATVYKQFGEIYFEKGDKPKAKEWFNKTLVILHNLESQDSLTVDEKRMFTQIQEKLDRLK